MDEVFPAEAEFSGMPHNRWWEFEDGVMNFGFIQPNKTDIRLLLKCLKIGYLLFPSNKMAIY